MLFDTDVLEALHNKLGTKYKTFDINLFLRMLQSSTRPLGYPPYRNDIDDGYYLKAIRDKTANAKNNQNGHQFQSLMRSIYQMMVCFCYFQETLNLVGIDEELSSLLYTAIEKREDTTDEEICAEKSLLAMILNQPQEMLLLFSEYQYSIQIFNIKALLEEQIRDDAKKTLISYLESLPKDISFEAINRALSRNTEYFTKIEKSLSLLSPFMIKPKITCQIIIGFFLLESFNDRFDETWIRDSEFLQTSIAYANKEKAKIELSHYFNQRRIEDDPLGFFKKYSKKTKLEAAKKLYNVFNNDIKVTFHKKELDAVQADTNSRLTDIYERYQDFAPPLKKQ